MAKTVTTRKRQWRDFDTALKARDVLTKIVVDTIDKHRPKTKQAVVVDFDRQTLMAEVRFPGDDNSVQAMFPANLQPKRRTMDNPDGSAVGDIVHVEGGPGNYRVTALMGSGAASADQTLINPGMITSAGIEELLQYVVPQPGDIRYTFRDVAGGGTVLPGNWVLLDNSLVTRSAPFAAAWQALGSPVNGTDGTNWRLEDGRDRSPWGAGGDITLRGDEGSTLANRGPNHNHLIPGGGSHNHTHNHTHGINPTNHNGTSSASGFTVTGGSINVVQQVNGTVATSHAHGGDTQLPGDATTGTTTDHDHSGFTGGGTGNDPKLGWKGVNWLMKL